MATVDPNNRNAPTEEAGMDFSMLWLIIRERWLGSLAFAILVTVPVAWYLLSRPSVYQAQATLLVERSNDRVVDIKQVTDQSVDGGMTDTLIQTHIEQMRNHSFLQQVVTALSAEELNRVLQPYHNPKVQPPPGSNANLDAQRVEGLLLTNYSVARVPKTLLLRIAVKHRDPAIAEKLANLIADQYIAYLIKRSNTSNTAAMGFLQGQTEELRKRVEQAERDLQTYREKYNLVSLEDNQNIVVDRLKALNTAVTNARIARLSIESKRDQILAIIKRGASPQELATLSEFAALAAVEREIEDLRTKRAVLGERYGKGHPSMQENARSLESLEKLRDQQLAVAQADLANQCEKALAQERQVEGELTEASKESLRLDQLAVGYNVLRREVETTRQTYSQILARQNETNVASQLQNTNIKSVDRAILPDTAVEPNRKKLPMLITLLALLSAVGFGTVGNALDRRIKSWNDIERYLRLSVLGEISMCRNIQKEDRDRIVTEQLDSTSVELFRGLHSQLEIQSKVKSPKTILMSSTIPTEGKSFVSSNLAATFAAHNKKCLLVDCDFRRPSLHRGFKVPNKKGIITFLAAAKESDVVQMSLADIGVVRIAEGFDLLPTGGVSQAITEQVENPAFQELFRKIKSQYDIVILDTPPAGVFPDALALSRFANEMLIVFRFGVVDRNRSRSVIDRLAQTGIPIAGCILNAMPKSLIAHGYYSGYGYYGGKYYSTYSSSEE